MGGNRRGFPLQDKAATDVQARYPNGKEGYYQVWKDCRPSLTKEFGKITPTLLNIIQVARDKAALGVGRETVAKEDGRMDKDMLGGWGRHTNQVCVFVEDFWQCSHICSRFTSNQFCWELSLFSLPVLASLFLASPFTGKLWICWQYKEYENICFTGLWMQKDQNLRSLSKSSWTGFRWFWILPGP